MGAVLSLMRLLFRRGSGSGYSEAVMTDEEIVTRVSGVQLLPMGPAVYAGPPPSFLSQPAAVYPPPPSAAVYQSSPPAEPYSTYHPPAAYASTAPYATTAAAYHSAAPPQNNYELSPPVEFARFDAAYCALLFAALLERHRALLGRSVPSAQVSVLQAIGEKLYPYTSGSSFAYVRPERCYSGPELHALDDRTLVRHAADVLDELESQIEAMRTLPATRPAPDRPPQGF